MGVLGQRLAAATAWAERIRPPWYLTLGALSVLAGILAYLELDLPLVARVVILACLVALYVVPLLVAVVRSFRAGLRNDDRLT